MLLRPFSMFLQRVLQVGLHRKDNFGSWTAWRRITPFRYGDRQTAVTSGKSLYDQIFSDCGNVALSNCQARFQRGFTLRLTLSYKTDSRCPTVTENYIFKAATTHASSQASQGVVSFELCQSREPLPTFFPVRGSRLAFKLFLLVSRSPSMCSIDIF